MITLPSDLAKINRAREATQALQLLRSTQEVIKQLGGLRECFYATRWGEITDEDARHKLGIVWDTTSVALRHLELVGQRLDEYFRARQANESDEHTPSVASGAPNSDAEATATSSTRVIPPTPATGAIATRWSEVTAAKANNDSKPTIGTAGGRAERKATVEAAQRCIDCTITNVGRVRTKLRAWAGYVVEVERVLRDQLMWSEL